MFDEAIMKSTIEFEVHIIVEYWLCLQVTMQLSSKAALSQDLLPLNVGTFELPRQLSKSELIALRICVYSLWVSKRIREIIRA